jgi:hypothetical protein
MPYCKTVSFVEGNNKVQPVSSLPPSDRLLSCPLEEAGCPLKSSISVFAWSFVVWKKEKESKKPQIKVGVVSTTFLRALEA